MPVLLYKHSILLVFMPFKILVINDSEEIYMPKLQLKFSEVLHLKCK